jgi:hypothetical protein
MRTVAAFVFASGMLLIAQSKVPSERIDDLPKFEEYPVTESYAGAAAEPVFATSEQRRYRTRIHEGVSKGSGVWSGSWKNPQKSAGPNLAGRYYVIRWGCGSDCLMMAIVDAQSGEIYNPPLSRKGTELYVSMDPLSDREIDFQRDSSLMVLRNACREARRECGVYYFNWQQNRFVLVKRTLTDLSQAR